MWVYTKAIKTVASCYNTACFYFASILLFYFSNTIIDLQGKKYWHLGSVHLHMHFEEVLLWTDISLLTGTKCLLECIWNPSAVHFLTQFHWKGIQFLKISLFLILHCPFLLFKEEFIQINAFVLCIICVTAYFIAALRS